MSHIPETINVTLQTQGRILVIETFTWLIFELSLRFITEITITIVFPAGWVGSLLKSILNNNRPIAFYINTLVLYPHYIWQMSNSTPNRHTILMCSRWIRQMDVFQILGCTVFCYCLVQTGKRNSIMVHVMSQQLNVPFKRRLPPKGTDIPLQRVQDLLVL